MNPSTSSKQSVKSEQGNTQLLPAEFKKPMSFIEEMLFNAERARTANTRLLNIRGAMATASSANGSG